MSEQNLAPMMDDMELVTLYINEQLPADQMEQVRERLHTDAEFRHLAEPMLFASALLRQQLSRPRAPGELEKHWNEFTKRAGFVQQKERARKRRLWWLAIVVATIGLSGFLARGRIQGAYRDWRDYAPVVASTGWIRIRDHIEVRLEPGARLRAAKEIRNNAQRVKLQGNATFRVQPIDTTEIMPKTQPLVVLTAAGEVFSGMGDFIVNAIGDTTVVEVVPPARRRYVGFMPFPSMTLVRSNSYDDPMIAREGQRIRLVRGIPPERLDKEP